MSKASQLRQKAQNALKKGKVQEAVDIYRKLLQVEPRNPNLYNELGDIFLHSSDRIQAVSSFEQAILNYEKVALYNNAVAVCKKILRIVPNRPETFFKLGELKAKQKFSGEAAVFFTQYFDSVLEGGALPEGVQRKVEIALELLPASEEVLSRGADVLERAGHSGRAAAVLAGLIAGGGVDAQRSDIYRRRLDRLMQSLGAEDKARIDDMLGPAATHVQTEPAPAAEAGPAASRADTEPAAYMDATSGEAPQEVYEAAGKPGATGEAPQEKFEADAVFDAPAESAFQNGSGVPVRRSAPQPGQPDRGAPAAEDLSDILEAEDAALEAARSDTRRLAEEITSDVEEDDFRSHYDLGMAYIEMALYNEAIKELQISARSEQLQLRSIEMIGHCFLLMQNPRLAVKQLLRGLDIARIAGGETLGIHYNLGLAYEALGEIDKAREQYEEVYIVDVTFREISDKMTKFSTVK